MANRRRLLDRPPYGATENRPYGTAEQIYPSFHPEVSPLQVAQVLGRRRALINPDVPYEQHFGNIYEQYAPPTEYGGYIEQLAKNKEAMARGETAMPMAQAGVTAAEMKPGTEQIAAESPAKVAGIITAPEITKAETAASEPAMRLSALEEGTKAANEAMDRMKKEVEIQDIMARSGQRGVLSPQEATAQKRLDRINYLESIPPEVRTDAEKTEYDALWMGIKPGYYDIGTADYGTEPKNVSVDENNLPSPPQRFEPTGVAGSKSPYPEYPDAFLEGGVWKVIRNGQKYRVQD